MEGCEGRKLILLMEERWLIYGFSMKEHNRGIQDKIWMEILT
jgi:hypothetical protein